MALRRKPEQATLGKIPPISPVFHSSAWADEMRLRNFSPMLFYQIFHSVWMCYVFILARELNFMHLLTSFIVGVFQLSQKCCSSKATYYQFFFFFFESSYNKPGKSFRNMFFSILPHFMDTRRFAKEDLLLICVKHLIYVSTFSSCVVNSCNLIYLCVFIHVHYSVNLSNPINATIQFVFPCLMPVVPTFSYIFVPLVYSLHSPFSTSLWFQWYSGVHPRDFSPFIVSKVLWWYYIMFRHTYSWKNNLITTSITFFSLSAF